MTSRQIKPDQRADRKGNQSPGDPQRLPRRHGIVGKRFEHGEYFISELILAGEILKSVSAEVKPLIKQDASVKKAGKILIGTVKATSMTSPRISWSLCWMSMVSRSRIWGSMSRPRPLSLRSKSWQPDIVAVERLPDPWRTLP